MPGVLGANLPLAVELVRTTLWPRVIDLLI